MPTCRTAVYGSVGLATVMLLSGCAGVLELDEALTVIPYTTEPSGRIVVDVEVDGRGPYPFILDTGASISVIFEKLKNKAGLLPISDSRVLVHGVVTSGTFPLLDVSSLGIGDETLRSPRIVLLPNETGASAGVDGLLGVDFLRRYAVGFSARERVLRLYPRDIVAQRSYRGWDSIPLRAQVVGQSGAKAYFVDIQIGGRSLPAALDLGSSINMINIPGADRLDLVTARARGDKITGTLGSLPAVSRFTARSVRTSNTRWRKEDFLVADLAIFETFGLDDRPAAILGAGFFTQRDFVLDFARNRLLVKSGMKEVPAATDSDTGGQAP